MKNKALKMQYRNMRTLIKPLFCVLLSLGLQSLSAQVNTVVVGDTVRIKGNNGDAELILENSTKNVSGFLFNTGGGRTEFKMVNDHAIQTLEDSSTIVWDVSLGANGNLTLEGSSRTLSVVNAQAGHTYRIKISQDSVGNRSISTWPSEVKWPGGVAPTLSSNALSIDMVTLYYDGLNFFGDYSLLFKPIQSAVSIASYDARNNYHATVHSLSDIPAGALLVLTTCAGSSGGNATVSSSPSLTWTKQVDASASVSGDAEIYTAIFPAGGSITITSDFGNQPQSSVCYAVINNESSLGGNTATGTAQSAPSVSLNTTRSNSIIIAVTSDWNAVDGSSRAYRNSSTETQYAFSSGAGTGYHYYKVAETTGSYTVGLTAPSSQSSGTAVIEIRGN